MNTEPNLATHPEDDIDLFEIFQTIAEGKWLILVTAVVTTLAATGLAFWMTPKYEAKVIAAFAEEGKTSGLGALAGQFGGLAEMAGINLGAGGGNKENHLAFLKSRAFLDTFIEQHQLTPILFHKLWDSEQKKWRTDDPSKVPTPFKAYDLFTKSVLNLQSDKKTGLITLSITWKDRELAADWANQLIRDANESLRNKAILETETSLEFLQKELQKTSVSEVQNTIYRIMESQIKSKMLANTQQQFAFKVIDAAAVADPDAFSQPKRLLMISLGVVSGLFLGIIAVLVRKSIRNRRP